MSQDLKNTGHVVIKPKVDQRDYEFFTLPNNLDVLLISDSATDTAAACLACGVGSLCDPVEALGLYHFLEHMLFMGSTKFPSEEAYPNYISTHGGMSNAWTAATETVYYFDIDANYLDGALDRFAQFFIAPLFDPSSTDRELNAVHSEHDKNVYNDSWRAFDTARHVYNPDHPASRFHTGNLDTLKEEPLKQGTDVRSLLLSGYKDHYSSNLMKLAIVGKESLEDLKKKAIEYFSAVPDTQKQTPTFSTDLLKDRSHVVEICPSKQQRAIKCQWVLPSDEGYIDTQPVNLISHAFGDEGAKSLLSLLKAKRYATALSCGRESRTSFGTTFTVSIDVSELGLVNLPDLIRIVFAFIEMMTKRSDEDWLRMCTEAQKIDINNFDARVTPSPVDAVTGAIDTMFLYKPENLLQGDTVCRNINLDHIRHFLKEFTLQNCWFNVIAQDTARDVQLFSDENNFTFEELTTKHAKVASFANEATTCDELNATYKSKKWTYNQYYKNRWAKYPLSESVIKHIGSGLTQLDLTESVANEPGSYGGCTTVDDLLDLPAPNPFIPDSFDLIAKDDVDTVPSQQQNDQHVPIAVYVHNTKVTELPLVLDDKSEDKEVKNAVLSHSFYDSVSSTPIDAVPPRSNDEFKSLISGLVQDSLIGFDLEHLNTGLGDGETTSQKDLITPDIIKSLFKRTDELYGKSMPPSVEAAKKELEAAAEKPEADAEQVEAEGDEDHEEDGDEDAHDEDHEAGEEEGEDSASTSVAKLFTCDRFFTEKDDKAIRQFIPPQQVPIPLPVSHFPLSTGRSTLSIPTYTSPILPPIECYYKFTDAYNTANVEIQARILFPGIDASFLAIYALALTDFLAEKLYPATNCQISHRVFSDSTDTLAVNVSGHRQGAAETFNTIIGNLFNPLLFNQELFLRQCDKYKRSLLSVPMQGAFQQCSQHLGAIVNRNVLHPSQRAISLDAFIGAVASYLDPLYPQKFVTSSQFVVIGNVTKPYTIRLAQNMVLTLNLTESLFQDVKSNEPIFFPDASNTVALVANGNPLDNQNALINFYNTLEPFRTGFNRTKSLLKLKQRGLYSEPIDKKSNKLDLAKIENGTIFNHMSFYGNIVYNYLISHLMSDHSFDSLRTKQQLGYIAQSRHHFSLAGYALAVLVQSSFSSSHVDQRIEYYMRKELKEYLASDEKCIFNHENYIANLAGAQKGLLNRFVSNGDEIGYFSNSIFSRQYDWYRQLILGLMIPYAHRHVILGYYNHWFCDLSQRRKFAIHVVQQGGNTEDNTNAYQDQIPQDVYEGLDSVLGLKHLFPGVKF